MLTRKIPFDTLLCNAETLNINAQQIIPSTYLWNDGSLSFQRTLALPGNYRLLTNDGVCKRSDSFTITRNFTPFVSIGNDTTLCESEKLILFASSLFADDLIWNTNSRGTSIIVSTPGNYSVAASNGCGTVTDAVKIDYTDCADVIFVPNAFTPNTDRTNDVLYARAYFKIDEFKFLIFNRWGQEVFVSSSILNGWDGFVKGIKAPVGLYSWKIQYSRKGKQYHQKGTVLLIY
jgi:gliding motility-associated-like protein